MRTKLLLLLVAIGLSTSAFADFRVLYVSTFSQKAKDNALHSVALSTDFYALHAGTGKNAFGLDEASTFKTVITQFLGSDQATSGAVSGTQLELQFTPGKGAANYSLVFGIGATNISFTGGKTTLGGELRPVFTLGLILPLGK